MQEETTQKTIALAIKTSKLTASVLQKAMKMYLELQKHKEPSHGKIPVKKLVGQGEGAKSIEVTDSNITTRSKDLILPSVTSMLLTPAPCRTSFFTLCLP